MADHTGVRVTILDQVYHLRAAGGSDAEQVERAASYVDTRMRAIAARTRDVDSLRIAVLTALHIADEYHTLKARYEQLQAAVAEKSEEFSRLLESEIRKAV